MKHPDKTLDLQEMPAGFVLALIAIAAEQPALVGYFQTEPLPTWAQKDQS